MPQPETFRGDPYAVLDVAPGSTDAAIKRRWRELAHEHHPDRAGGDEAATATLTRRMARINAAYELLRDKEQAGPLRPDPRHPRWARHVGAAG